MDRNDVITRRHTNGKDLKALTLEELKSVSAGTHIWVRELKTYRFPEEERAYSRAEWFPALYDYVDGKGAVAIWTAESLEDLLTENDYGRTWWAYLRNPQEDPNVKRWEYNHAYIAIHAPSREDDPNEHFRSAMLEEQLNRWGAKGWELVSISPGLLDGEYIDGYALFKRRVRAE